MNAFVPVAGAFVELGREALFPHPAAGGVAPPPAPPENSVLVMGAVGDRIPSPPLSPNFKSPPVGAAAACTGGEAKRDLVGCPNPGEADVWPKLGVVAIPADANPKPIEGVDVDWGD